MPPDVPATVSAAAVVGFATEIRPLVNETLVTVPLPAPQLPVLAAVSRPCASTVILEQV